MSQNLSKLDMIFKNVEHCCNKDKITSAYGLRCYKQWRDITPDKAKTTVLMSLAVATNAFYRKEVGIVIEDNVIPMSNILENCKEQDIQKLSGIIVGTVNKDKENTDFFEQSERVLLQSLIWLLTQGSDEKTTWANNKHVMGDLKYPSAFASICELLVLGSQKWTADCGIPCYFD